jgi:hypothetical protein
VLDLVQGSGVLQALDAAAIRRWCEDGRSALAAARLEIDGLNVFPVPDGDTGTNLLLTVESVVAAVGVAGQERPAVAAALARGALMGARGNSGVILSQLLRGVAEVLADGPVDGPGMQRALGRGADLAYAAVAAPVEGTLLTVARSAADAAAVCEAATLADVLAAACSGARSALTLTQQQLPALTQAGVVDAGGRGWVVLLEALAAVVTGLAPIEGRPEPTPPAAVAATCSGPGYSGPAYEVQYLLEGATEAAVGRLRETLSGLGDSLAVVCGDGLHNVHVHVDDIGAAIEAGLRAGRPSQISVTRFADAPVDAASAATPVPRAVVAVCTGDGLVRLFRQAGAVVVEGAPTTAELLAAVQGAAAPRVVLLLGCAVRPDDAAVVEGARAAGVEVRIVNTRSVVQGLSALAVADAAREFDDDVAAMTEAAAATRTAEVTVAVRGATTSAGVCVPGDALGVVDGTVAVVGADVGWVAVRLLERLCAGAELVTAVLGQDAPAGLADRLREHALRCCPEVELAVIDGGQPSPPVLLGAE